MRSPRHLRVACAAVAFLAAGTVAVAAAATTGHADPAVPGDVAPTPSATITDSEGGPHHVRVATVPAVDTRGVARTTYSVPLTGSATKGTVVAFTNTARVAAARAAGAQSVPWIAWVHGGGWVQGSPDDAAAVYFCSHAAALGISCFSLGYTLAPAAHWPVQQDQVDAELAWVRAHAKGLHLDPHAGFVLGHSAGALMAGIAGLTTTDTATDTATDPTDDTTPALAGIGLLDGATDVPTIIDSRFRPSVARYASELVHGPGDVDSASVAAHIPAEHTAVPVLLLHDAADPIISAQLSVHLAGSLQRAGYPVTLDLLPGSTHFTEYDPTALGAIDAWIEGRLAVVGAQYPAPAIAWAPPSTVGLTLSAASTAAGSPLTATVGVHGYNGPAVGVVTVYRDGARAGSATLESGRAVVRLTAPATSGRHVYTARYLGHVTHGHGWSTYAAARSPRHLLVVRTATATARPTPAR